jgi:hypothetical protein
MSIYNRPKLNRLIDPVSGLPVVHGDYYRPADRIIDIQHAEGQTGDFLSETFTAPSILSGLVISVNSGNNQRIDITAGGAVGFDPQLLTINEHNYDGTLLSGLDAITGYTHPININSGLRGVTRFIIIESNLTAQTTTNVGVGLTGFVKLRYKDQSLFTRKTPADPTGTAYSFLTRDSFELIIDTIAATAADVCLGSFTKDAFGAIITISTTPRNPNTGLQLKNGFLDLPGGRRLKLNDSALTADRIFTLPNRDMTIAATDEAVTAGASISAGTVVYITGDDSGNVRPVVQTISAFGQTPFGYAVSAIANTAGGLVIRSGRVVTALNASAAAVGDSVYVTSTGTLSLTWATYKIGVIETATTNAVVFFNFVEISPRLFQDGTVSLPGVSWLNETNSGRYRISANTFGEAINGIRVGQFGVGYGGFTGNIIQVLQTSIDTQLSTSSTSYVDITGLSVSITPKYSTSKILIRFKINGSNSSTSALNAYQIVRDSTAIGNGAQGSRRFCHSAVRGSVGDVNSSYIVSGEFLDSPSTTSATIYKMQFLVDSSTGYINRDDGNGNTINYPSPLSSITVMEIQQ